MPGSQVLRSASTQALDRHRGARRLLGRPGKGRGGDVGRRDLPAVSRQPDRLGALSAAGIQRRPGRQLAGLAGQVGVRRDSCRSRPVHVGLLPMVLPVVLVEFVRHLMIVPCVGPRWCTEASPTMQRLLPNGKLCVMDDNEPTAPWTPWVPGSSSCGCAANSP